MKLLAVQVLKDLLGGDLDVSWSYFLICFEIKVFCIFSVKTYTCTKEVKMVFKESDTLFNKKNLHRQKNSKGL